MTHTLDREPAATNRDRWEQGVTVVKLNPAGREMARYPAEWIDEAFPETWFAVRATWTMARVNACGLVFEPGDTLIEYFSTEHWYNAFRVLAPDGTVRGIYGNVTYPTSVIAHDGKLEVTWHDLYLDVLRFPDGSVLLCDEDELADSGLEADDFELYGNIRATADVMARLARSATFPFHTS